jgi:hypothetical protein
MKNTLQNLYVIIINSLALMAEWIRVCVKKYFTFTPALATASGVLYSISDDDEDDGMLDDDEDDTDGMADDDDDDYSEDL